MVLRNTGCLKAHVRQVRVYIRIAPPTTLFMHLMPYSLQNRLVTTIVWLSSHNCHEQQQALP